MSCPGMLSLLTEFHKFQLHNHVMHFLKNVYFFVNKQTVFFFLSWSKLLTDFIIQISKFSTVQFCQVNQTRHTNFQKKRNLKNPENHLRLESSFHEVFLKLLCFYPPWLTKAQHCNSCGMVCIPIPCKRIGGDCGGSTLFKLYVQERRSLSFCWRT